MNPRAIDTLNDSLRAEDHTKLLKIAQVRQLMVNLIRSELFQRFKAPTGKHFIRVMVMMVMMLVTIVIVMMLVMTTAVTIVVVVMMVLFLVMVIVITIVMSLVMMVMMRSANRTSVLFVSVHQLFL